MGLRVDEEEEMKGLDISEHGMESYADFQPASDKLV
jgi:Amt family ammonium transporter